MKRKIQTEAEKEQNVGLMVKYPAEGKAGKDHKKLAWLPLAPDLTSLPFFGVFFSKSVLSLRRGSFSMSLSSLPRLGKGTNTSLDLL